MRKIGLAIFLMGWMVSAIAVPIKPVQVQLHVLSIKMLNTTEKHGDELYLNITEFKHDHSVNHFTMPELPAVWKSSDLSLVKPLVLWQQTIEQGQPEELLITLVEHDTPPWDEEDILGVVKLHLRNVDGKLINTWAVQTTANVKTIDSPQGKIEEVEFSGHHGGYIIDFQLTTS